MYDTDKSFEFSNCQFFALAQRKKHLLVSHPNITIIPNDNPVGFPRFNRNCDFVDSIMQKYKPSIVAIEGYSYGSNNSSLFETVENCGIMKNTLYNKYGIEVVAYPPTVIKKVATHSGKSKKTDMYAAWLRDTGVDLAGIFTSKPDSNPISDIVDSYYVTMTWLQKTISPK